MTGDIKICSRCVLDTTDSEINFDDKGVCNHCRTFELNYNTRMNANNGFPEIIDKIKADGRNKEYDCIIGVSGGIDSTYLAYLAKKNGLRPLAVHFDNGWNSELAVSNIEKVLKKLNIDLYTYVIDWEEFKSLQIAFLKASTPDSEVPTDHAIFALLLREANKRNIKYFLSGMNYKTESIMPDTWSYGHADWQYIKSINKQFGTVKLKYFPRYNFLYLFYTFFIKRMKMISWLNYVDFDKDQAMKILQDELDWKYYGGKHYESIYTRFFQSYILPKKFNIDKRKGHFSNLINIGQMTREEALAELKKETYPADLLANDKEYVIKKLGLTNDSFEEIMMLKPKTFRDYKTNYTKINKLKKIYNYLRNKKFFPK